MNGVSSVVVDVRDSHKVNMLRQGVSKGTGRRSRSTDIGKKIPPRGVRIREEGTVCEVSVNRRPAEFVSEYLGSVLKDSG